MIISDALKSVYLYIYIVFYFGSLFVFSSHRVWIVLIFSLLNLFALMKVQMHKFREKIVHMMKAERLYESQGGPIILSQVGIALSFNQKKCNIFFQIEFKSDFLTFVFLILWGIKIREISFFANFCYRLKMNMDLWSTKLAHLVKLTPNRQPEWLEGLAPVHHGSCASKMISLILLINSSMHMAKLCSLCFPVLCYYCHIYLCKSKSGWLGLDY